MNEIPAGSTTGEHVSLTVPADATYLTFLRSAVAGMAARTEAGVDVIEDLRIAVDEAVTLLLNSAEASNAVQCDIWLADHGITIEVSATAQGELPGVGDDSYSWMVLDAILNELRVENRGGRVTISMQRAWDRGSAPVTA